MLRPLSAIPAQDATQILAGMTGPTRGDLLRRSLRDDPPALVPALVRPAFRKRSPAAAQVMADWDQIVGPALAGRMADAWGSFSGSFAMASAIAALAVVGAAFLPAPQKH